MICPKHGTFDDTAYAGCPICEIVGDERFAVVFDIEAVHWTEPGPHPKVKGTVYLSGMTDEQTAMVDRKLRACQEDIYETLTGTKAPTR